MENSKIKSLTGQVQLLLKNNWDFPQKLKQRLVLESNNVTNPYKFIAGLFIEGVLSDGSSDPEASFGLKEMMVQLAITIACSKGADAIGGLIKALEGSGNSQLISALSTWAKQEFGIEINGETSESKEGASAVRSPITDKLQKNMKGPTESSSRGTKLIDKITSHLEGDIMEELEGHLVGKASEILNTAEFCTSLAHQNVLAETDIQLETGPEVYGRQQIEKFIKMAFSKKAIGSLVFALQSSNNERILGETLDWLEDSQARKNNYPVSVKSLARKPRPTAKGIFAATIGGLIYLDLQTLKATSLSSEIIYAVAVNHKLNKVYWSEAGKRCRSCIKRSNFDGSDEKMIVPWDERIQALAIDEASGNVYFARYHSHEITVCNELGENCAAVISSPTLVEKTTDIALDSKNGGPKYGNSITRAKLDGSNATTIISTGFKSLVGIALGEPSNDVLYWSDAAESTIGTIDVNGGNNRTIIELKRLAEPRGVQVDAHKLYFSNFDRKSIESVDRYSGKELTEILKFKYEVNHLALFYAPVKQS